MYYREKSKKKKRGKRKLSVIFFSPSLSLTLENCCETILKCVAIYSERPRKESRFIWRVYTDTKNAYVFWCENVRERLSFCARTTIMWNFRNQVLILIYVDFFLWPVTVKPLNCFFFVYYEWIKSHMILTFHLWQYNIHCYLNYKDSK